MNIQDLLPVLLSFGITAVATPLLIPVLKRLKAGQTERKEGVKAHLAKAGTPTMGGIAIILGILIPGLIYLPGHPSILPVLILSVGFGLIGFLDDFLKVVLRRSDGLFPKQKLALQFLVTAVFLAVLTKVTGISLELRIPFSRNFIHMGWFSIVFAFIVILATVNGVNFTDGLDGLASSVSAVVALFFTMASGILGGQVEPVTLAVFGSLLGFLLWNSYPAKIFMGDTGSLALGGFVAAAAYVLQIPLYIPIVGFIYAFELVSVVLQVSYFKATHGKRIFKMTPIHHHFELCGWSETRIVATFTITTALLCLFGLCGLS
ncbi:phospho-N-acetylmuramoyl-pentapeptide-transferase [Bilifractor porci]|uniref:Phospho-N-acetylmuramoyl-pentapeptide-transferase n=1 Tax=Bilifractor porci TaxID=2606636 RepID=A0A7X2TNX7_9FIRM|nr:phospho-N-acetylmuramoyl-pentapeptide-transferase [Bilifractor porci]MST82030.1 phospho-N-acetylmuramoyl-pentapeptide-transferase [Bilifractor porci]